MLVYSTPQPIDCRSVAVPACEQDGDASQSAPIAALACFQMRKRDTVDFTVDWTDWLKANGNASLSNAMFAVSSDSPKTPTITGQAYAPAGKCVVVLSAGTQQAAPTAGDAYYIDITITVAATTPTLPTDVAIPARTLVRRINVVVVNG